MLGSYKEEQQNNKLTQKSEANTGRCRAGDRGVQKKVIEEVEEEEKHTSRQNEHRFFVSRMHKPVTPESETPFLLLLLRTRILVLLTAVRQLQVANETGRKRDPGIVRSRDYPCKYIMGNSHSWNFLSGSAFQFNRNEFHGCVSKPETKPFSE